MAVQRCRTTVLAVAVMLLSVVAPCQKGQIEKDPHRPICADTRCRQIRSFLKANYCGESPFGNGPDDGCDTRQAKKTGRGTKLIADFVCKWNDTDGTSKCEQRGQPPPKLRTILIREMRRVGLPARADKEVNFTVLEAKSRGWSLVAAIYDHISGDYLTLCQVIVVIDQSGQPHVLRTVRLQKTSAYESDVTTWAPVDIADVEGDGRVEFVLEGDSLEDHWFEVVSPHGDSFETIFVQ